MSRSIFANYPTFLTCSCKSVRSQPISGRYSGKLRFAWKILNSHHASTAKENESVITGDKIKWKHVNKATHIVGEQFVKRAFLYTKAYSIKLAYVIPKLPCQEQTCRFGFVSFPFQTESRIITFRSSLRRQINIQNQNENSTVAVISSYRQAKHTCNIPAYHKFLNLPSRLSSL